MEKKTSGGNTLVKDDFIKMFLLENDNIFKYEAQIAMRAFKSTIKYFFENAIPFQIDNFITLDKYIKKERLTHVTTFREFKKIPSYTDIKVKITKGLKDFLNSRYKYKDTLHREQLPDGTRKAKNIY